MKFWTLSWKLVSVLCNPGLALLAHSVPSGVEAVRGTQARLAQADTHSRLPCLGVRPLVLTQESIKRDSQALHWEG